MYPCALLFVMLLLLVVLSPEEAFFSKSVPNGENCTSGRRRQRWRLLLWMKRWEQNRSGRTLKVTIVASCALTLYTLLDIKSICYATMHGAGFRLIAARQSSGGTAPLCCCSSIWLAPGQPTRDAENVKRDFSGYQTVEIGSQTVFKHFLRFQ